ncbi:MAG: DNA replication/repair protein RecF [Legionella sp.]|nr:DNA replication/repair protein RecF [Legionella sp.]
MILDILQITNLRNINTAHLSFHPHLNIITGANGSGKTSFLEAIYLLGSGHSFRAREISALVTHQRDILTVFAKTTNGERVSIQKSAHLPTVARLNGAPCLTSSELAAFLPSQIFYQDIFQLIDAGPAVRRSLLDWGLFHFEPGYHELWKDYRRVLKQRNSLLKQRTGLSPLIPWNKKLSELAENLHDLRARYFRELVVKFNLIINELTDVKCTLNYYKGWDKKGEGKALGDVLNASYESDSLRQFTHYGAHQADLAVECDDFKAKHFLSRGQQKIVLFALKFAQAQFLSKTCLFLIDDMAAELDEEHINRLMQYMSTIDGQFFITARESDLRTLKLTGTNHSCFLIENGSFIHHDVSRGT